MHWKAVEKTNATEPIRPFTAISVTVDAITSSDAAFCDHRNGHTDIDTGDGGP